MDNPDLKTPEGIRDFALRRFHEAAKDKYDAGQVEHGGLITDRNLFDELEKEIIDAWFYLQATRIKHHELVERGARLNMDTMGMAMGDLGAADENDAQE